MRMKPDTHCLSAKILGQQRRRRGAQDNGDERAQFEDSVAPGKFFLGKQLRQGAIFGRTKERAVGAHQENTRE